MNRHNPESMACREAGEAMPSPEGISTDRFWYEDLLPGGADGDLAAIRADQRFPVATGTAWFRRRGNRLRRILESRQTASEFRGSPLQQDHPPGKQQETGEDPDGV